MRKQMGLLCPARIQKHDTRCELYDDSPELSLFYFVNHHTSLACNCNSSSYSSELPLSLPSLYNNLLRAIFGSKNSLLLKPIEYVRPIDQIAIVMPLT